MSGYSPEDIKRGLHHKWMEESETYQAWLKTLSESDQQDADYMYQDGVSFEDLQEIFTK